MSVQVEGTNDSSCLSKYSAVIRGYFEDQFLCHFVKKCPRRAPLIHIGYTVRAGIINALIEEFLEFCNGSKQVVSFGAGFDTLFFKLSKNNLSADVFYYELDLPRVIKNKISCINKSSMLRQTIGEFEEGEDYLICSNYKLLPIDLRDIKSVENLFASYGLSSSLPTLFLSECAITYLEEDRSSDLIKLASGFENATFVTYEQINPDDAFGQVMLKHFSSVQSPLLSVARYPTLHSQAERYINCGWQNCSSTSAIDAYNTLLPAEERQRVLRLEPFDEWEELYLKCVHYTVTIASNGSLRKWSKLCNNSFNSEVKNISSKNELIWIPVNIGSTDRYSHSVVSFKDQFLLIGGFGVRKDGTHGRMDHLTWLKRNGSELIVLQETEGPNLSSMYSTWTSIPSSDGEFIVYGGRRSPKECTFTTPQKVKFRQDGGLEQSAAVDSFDQPARWRHSAVIVKWNGIDTFVVFGGRTVDLSLLGDAWMIPLHRDESKKTVVTVSTSDGPCARFSHGCSVRHLESGCEMWVSGGYGSSGPLSDVWCLDMASLRWRQLATNMRPRFSHTTSITVTPAGQCLVVVGGLNWSHDRQPCIAVVSLQTGACAEYDSQSLRSSMMLVNHCHVLSADGKCMWIIGGGGNCFSFGTHFNKKCAVIQLDSLNCE